MNQQDKIVQITQATATFAVFVDKDGNEWCREPVLCWALTHDGKVFGLVTDGGPLHFVETRKDFGFYDPKGSKYKKEKRNKRKAK